MAGSKRKLEASETSNNKKPRPNFSDRSLYQDSTVEIEHGIVMRKFYPPELTNERAKQYASGMIERPIETLEKSIRETRVERDAIEVGNSVIHWYKCDTRIRDNRSLSLASEKAKSKNVPLICIYLVSPQDFEAHLTAPIRVDFILRNLEVLKQDLAVLDIPLYVETVEKRKKLPTRIFELCEEWKSNHLYCNTEYEVDELRRESTLIRDGLGKGVSVNVVADTCVVEPGRLKSGTGGQISIYSPWHRKWCAYLNSYPEILDECPMPNRNPSAAKTLYSRLFDCPIPDAPKGKQLPAEQKKKFSTMWPAGEAEAHQRLEKFLRERIAKYSDTRDLPAISGTSVLSPHLAAGTIAARTLIRLAREAAPQKKITEDRRQGHSMWIGEVAWRDFYKHVLCNWPYICMNKPFKPEYSKIEWEYDSEQFKRWTEGTTGFPIVDAAMRQASNTGYMHNRCRMIVASFLAKDLMIDWRLGEKWFMENLVDGDFASNNGGWGFSASCGVDPQAYFRIFNPLLQSEKFDPKGDYIRKWVPELKGLNDIKAIHDPYGRGAGNLAKENGYPKPMIDHKASRERALKRYKDGLGRSTA